METEQARDPLQQQDREIGLFRQRIKPSTILRLPGLRITVHGAPVQSTSLPSDPRYAPVRAGEGAGLRPQMRLRRHSGFGSADDSRAMPATTIGERIGWPYSIPTLSGRVAQLRCAEQRDDASRPSGRLGDSSASPGGDHGLLWIDTPRLCTSNPRFSRY
jgi:hypothetical protein